MTAGPNDTAHSEGDESSSHGAFAEILSSRTLAVARHPRPADDDTVFETTEENSPADVFPQSVASGGPTAAGVVLWTRIDPAAYEPGRPVGVEVARTPEFEDVVHRGIWPANHEWAGGRDHTVKVDLDGRLDPDETYAYRFVHDGTPSPIGRCRTLPAPDATPDSIRFAVLCCQDYLNGYFAALHHVAREDVDFVVHLGDAIYESAAGEFSPGGTDRYPGRRLSLPSGATRPRSIADYRHIYRTYRSDRFLREALEAHTFVPTWDDHEFFHDMFWDREREAPNGDHPDADNPAYMRHLAADALQAWWEYTPTRIDYDPTAEAFHERFQLWRTLELGTLAQLVVTDERLFRDQPHGSERVPIRRVMGPDGEPEGQTMLGGAQREWFLDEVRDSDRTWTVWANEVLTVPFKLGAGPLTLYPTNTGWDGYRRERQRIFTALAEADVSNFITLSGDMHCSLAGYQQTAYDDSLGRLVTGSSTVDAAERVGVELMTPPVTSINFAETAGTSQGWLGRITEPILSWGVRWQNPHLELFDSHHWGYSTVELTPEACTYTAYAVDKTTDSTAAEKEVLARLEVPEGRTEIRDGTGRATTSRDGCRPDS